MKQLQGSENTSSFDDWTHRIGAHIGALRDQRGWSAQQLANRTRDVGVEVSRSTIANLESGRKGSLSVVELAVIAAALDVAPVRLLFDVEGGPVEALPGARCSGLAAADWFSGLAPSPAVQPEDGKETDYAGPLSAHRQHKEITAKLQRLRSQAELDPALFEQLVDAYVTALHGIESAIHGSTVSKPGVQALEAQLVREQGSDA